MKKNVFTIVTMLAMSLLMATAAQAQDWAWDSAVSGNWNVAGNWDPTGIPGSNVAPGTNVTHINVNGTVGSPYTVTVNDTQSIGSAAMQLLGNYATLTIDNGGFLTTGALSTSVFSTGGGTPTTFNVNTGGRVSTGNITMTTGSIFNFDAGGAAAASSTGNMSIFSGAEVTFSSGTVNTGNITLTGSTTGTNNNFMLVNGATVNAALVQMNTTGGAAHGTIITVSAGTLNASGANNIIGNRLLTSAPEDFFTIKIDGTGTVNYSNNLILGGGQNAKGLLDMQAGTFAVNNLQLGRTTTAGTDAQQFGGSGQGYYNQTGGDATVNGTITLATRHDTTNGTDDFINGTRQFVVSSGAVLTLTGAGFAKSGTTDWLLTSDDVDLSGTIRFAPGASVTAQNLLVFSHDQGANMAGLVDNFAIGTLDLVDLVAEGAVLTFQAADTGRVLYVDSLLGLNGADDVTNFLDGTDMIVYYNVLNSTGLSGNYSFGTNSQLIMIPEPASLMLIGAGVALMLSRRRRQAVQASGGTPLSKKYDPVYSVNRITCLNEDFSTQRRYG